MSAAAARDTTSPWFEQAACQRFPIAWWFPESIDDIDDAHRAIDICNTCPVRNECLQFALDNDDRHGIFGGLFPFQRYEIKYNKTLRKDNRWLR
jgi:WhiB family redox-sensing transcriptional regulator